VQGVRHAVGEQRLDAGPGGEHLAGPHPLRGGIALASRVDIATDLSDNASQ
jgi:hypothetical protein